MTPSLCHGRGVRELIARLHAASPEFVRRWEQRPVCVRSGSTTKRLRHPVVGELTLECEVPSVAGHGQRLIPYTAAPGSPSAEAPKLLNVAGTQWTEDCVKQR